MRLSVDIGGLLPASALDHAVQEAGRMDMLVRTMEDERRDAGLQTPLLGDPLAFAFHAEFSGIWVALAYEVVRLLRQRNLLPGCQEATALMDGLEAVRVPLMKHEVQREKALTEPLQMGRVRPGSQVEPSYTYDPKDQRRAHIMARGLTPRGSLSWLTFDHRAGREQWMERRYLADLMLGITWQPQN
jgi:hypothetical protein